MAELNGRHYIDGHDLYQVFGILVQSGSDDFLQVPERKPGISYSWGDQHGIDVDLSRTFVKERTAQMSFLYVVATNTPEQDFWTRYNAFISLLQKPGTRRLTINEFGRDFFVYYQANSLWQRFTRIKYTTKIVNTFTLTLIEPNPTFTPAPTFLVNETGHFLIT